ncbi:MAG: acyl-CoA dehydrogenase [Deltaproteobacteria bacterium]|nr:MAG: acyl-CoA dehydrogenase [Deltaproteobacteria bacterium]
MQDDEIFTGEHREFRKTVRRFAESLAPHAEEWDEAGIFPREVFRQAGELGLLGIRFGEAYGGSGLDWWFTVAYAEELVRSQNAGVNLALMVQSDMATPIIDELGSDEVKREFLAPAIAGERIAALGVSEPGCGSDVASIRTTAKRDGDDYVISGQKLWITNGTRADFITLAVRTGGEGFGGISLLVCPTDVKGFEVSRKLKKIGNRASDTAELFFDEVRVPRRFLLGEENHGFLHIMTNFQGERLIGAIASTAGMEEAIRQTRSYAEDRSAFGRPVGKFQVWRHKLAEHLTSVEASKRLNYYAVDRFMKDPFGATREITMAKLFAGDLSQRVMYDCMQLHGGFGYTTEYPIGRWWTDARLITIGGGTSEIMKEILVKLEGL